jgi:hypothetical protein
VISSLPRDKSCSSKSKNPPTVLPGFFPVGTGEGPDVLLFPVGTGEEPAVLLFPVGTGEEPDVLLFPVGTGEEPAVLLFPLGTGEGPDVLGGIGGEALNDKGEVTLSLDLVVGSGSVNKLGRDPTGHGALAAANASSPVPVAAHMSVGIPESSHRTDGRGGL